MRVLRVLVGVLLLMIAVPTLLVGAGAWYAMQHRDSNGDFRASLQTMARPGFAVVVPDLDALLRRDAPFTRAGRTGLTVSAHGNRQLFLGLAAPADVASVLGAAGYTRIDQVRLGRGPLSVRSTALPGTGRPVVPPPMQAIWERAGTNELSLDPSMWRGESVALVVAAADGEPLGDLTIVATLDPLWLNSTTWGLLILGPVLLLLGFAVLAWPTRPRPVLYVLETVPSAPTQPTAQKAPSTPPGPAIPAQNAIPAAVVPGVVAVPLAIPAAVVPSTSRGETGLPGAEKARVAAKRDEGGEGEVAVPPGDLPGWPVAEAARRTERAVNAPTAELPLVTVQSPLDIPTAEMPLVGAPVRVKLTR